MAHAGALIEQPLDFRMNGEAPGNSSERICNLAEIMPGDPGLDFVVGLPRATVELVPILRQGAQGRLFLHGLASLLRFFKLSPNSGYQMFGRQALLLRVNFPQSWMVFDLLIEERLGDGWIIHLTVAVPTKADHVDHHVGTATVR